MMAAVAEMREASGEEGNIVSRAAIEAITMGVGRVAGVERAQQVHILAVNGAVVNVTSCAGISAQAYSAAYCATKAGLNHMTKSVAIEYIHKPIRFNAVAPGGMLTTMTRNVQFPADVDREVFQRASPLRGLVAAEDVAKMVAFLTSDAAHAYHGAIITIDNGITAG